MKFTPFEMTNSTLHTFILQKIYFQFFCMLFVAQSFIEAPHVTCILLNGDLLEPDLWMNLFSKPFHVKFSFFFSSPLLHLLFSIFHIMSKFNELQITLLRMKTPHEEHLLQPILLLLSLSPRFLHIFNRYIQKVYCPASCSSFTLSLVSLTLFYLVVRPHSALFLFDIMSDINWCAKGCISPRSI